jgi:hypothetical protein
MKEKEDITPFGVYGFENEEGGITICLVNEETGKLRGEENFKKGVTFPKDENGFITPKGISHGFYTLFDENGDWEERIYYQNNEKIFWWKINDDGLQGLFFNNELLTPEQIKELKEKVKSSENANNN